MPDSSEESKRISMQLSYISTQLIESMDKQTQLEDKLRKSRRTIQEQEAVIHQYTDLKMRYDQLDKNFIQKKIQVGKLETELEKDRHLRVDAENKVDVLNKEVEELTASLFDEANKMVATARREVEDVEIRSMKLLEQIHEKDTILETLTLQLKNLKKVLHDLQTENSSNGTASNLGSIIMNDSVNLSSYSLNKVPTSNSFSVQDLSHFAIYTPRVPAIRFDLYMYDEFLKFIAVLPYCDSIKQTASESKLLRRLVNDEITPVLRLDNANSLGWLIKRTLMTMMIEGLVVIEPLSGVNETYRTGNTFPNVKINQSFTKSFENKGFHLFNFPADSPPVALHEPCAFCGECRDDIIEHARMYVLKTQSKSDDGTLTITNQFPLCQNCLIKVRQTCEIFAFLRSLKLGAWNLEKVTLATIAKGDSKKFTKVTSSGASSEEDINEKNMKRRSFMAGFGMNSLGCTRVKAETAISLVDQAGLPTTNIQRAWIQLCKLRSMLHWAHIGVWSSENSISTTFGPHSDDMGNMDNQSASDLSESESSNIMNSKNISEESFTSVKEDGNDSEFFDFENKKITTLHLKLPK